MHDEELTPAEREALGALPREAEPGDLLEERAVRALVVRGWIRSAGRRRPPLAWVAAACVLFFAAGFALGHKRAAELPRERPSVASPESTRRPDALRARPGGGTQLTLAPADSSTTTGTQYVVWF